MHNIPCVIFAGGKSSRMGEDKSLLPFGGYESMAQYQYEHMKNLFDKVYISTKKIDKFDFEASFIEDKCDEEIYAPTAGFVTLFDQLEDERVFVISVDTPFVNSAVINELFKYDTSFLDVTIAKSKSGIHPMCGIYHRSLHNKFKEMLAHHDHRLGALLKSANTKYVEFSDEEPFTNLNHPHEYHEALTRELLLKKEIYELNSPR